MGDLTTVDGLKAELARAGERLLDSGKNLAVFRRRSDGAWRWATDMLNSDAG